MRHQFHVIPVVTPQIAQSIAEVLPVTEKRRKVRKAAGGGITPNINDLRVRQCYMNETDMPKVEGLLVDEKAAPVIPSPTCARQIVRTQTSQGGRIERVEPDPIFRLQRRMTLKPRSKQRNVRQLSRPFDGRVACEYLLDQR